MDRDGSRGGHSDSGAALPPSGHLIDPPPAREPNQTVCPLDFPVLCRRNCANSISCPRNLPCPRNLGGNADRKDVPDYFVLSAISSGRCEAIGGAGDCL